MASAGLAAGAGEILNAQTLSSSKNKNEKVKIAYVSVTAGSKLLKILPGPAW